MVGASRQIECYEQRCGEKIVWGLFGGQENSPVELEQREWVEENEEIRGKGLELERQFRAVSPGL